MRKNLKIVNLTPHPVNVYGDMELAPKFSLPPCDRPARVTYAETFLGQCIKRKTIVGVENFPEPKDGTVYVVSNPFRLHFPDRTDFVSPCAEVRKNGITVGCKWLQSN